ncbi:substrate-binding periplasmic protein [Pseudoalteromonas sp. T1lg75]|uniref:substrate-binding periplasmic protein n=1 Tax=Pseudoalteromonas sp. T1lg75 TaxID=2077102 RepID=UPI001F1781E0|nr:transporter substrate-binding domain-containing protein [Pseudoalteromonas sp. T1lg75]
MMRAWFWVPLILLLSTPMAGAQVSTITVAIDHAPPYSDTDGPEPRGLLLDILAPIAAELGLEVRVVPCPFSRCVHMLEQNEVDIMGGLIRTKQREQGLTFVTPAYMALHSSFRFYSLRASDLDITDYEDLHGKRIAVMRGAAHFARFDKDSDIIKVPVTSEQVAVQMLLKKRVDLFIGVEETADHAMSILQQPVHQLIKQPYHFQDSIFGHMAYSRDFASSIRAKQITSLYRSMAEQGRLTELVKPYALPPIQGHSEQ